MTSQTILQRAAEIRSRVANKCGDPSEMIKLLPLLIEAKQESIKLSRIRAFEVEIARYRLVINQAGATP